MSQANVIDKYEGPLHAKGMTTLWVCFKRTVLYMSSKWMELKI